MVDNLINVMKQLVDKFDVLTQLFKDRPIEILMLGPSGVGKTTVLAGLFHEYQQNQELEGIKLYTDSKTESELLKRLDELREEINSKELVVEKKLESTQNDILYKFYLADTKNSKNKIEINFTDIRGGDVTDNLEKVREKLKNTDVIIIPIDSAALMEEDDFGKNYADTINALSYMETLLKEVAESDKEQMIVFLLVKSESYFDKNLSKLFEVFKRKYERILRNLNKQNKVLIFLPIKTLGQVKFKEIRLNEKEPVFVYTPTTVNADYKPENVDLVFKLIITYVLEKMYREKKKSFASFISNSKLKVIKEQKEKFASAIKKDKNHIGFISGEDKLLG